MITPADLTMVWRLFRYDAERQKKRIALTVLAIAWGTLTLVLLVSMGEGTRTQVNRGSRSMGEGIAVVWGGSTTRPFMGLPSGRRISLRQEDVDAVRAQVPEIAAISAEYVAWQTPLTVGRRTIAHRVQGVEPYYGEMRNYFPQAGGRFLDATDQAERRRVVFLGNKLADDLYGHGLDPVGRDLQIRDAHFIVVGVLEPKLQTDMYAGPDAEMATIPSTTFAAMFGDAGKTAEWRTRPSNFVYKPQSPEVADAVKERVYGVLGGRLRFDPDDVPALRMWDTRVNQRMTNNLVLGIEIFLGIVGAITVFIGGMGVANVMYALVKERTREIGIMMALGAKVQHVMLPFVLESLIMTALGGLAGTLVSMAILKGIASLPGEGMAAEILTHPSFSPMVAVGTSLVIGAVGLLAGFLPARRAAAVDPAVSLRYE
jgi:putative ABC transport system permease protein